MCAFRKGHQVACPRIAFGLLFSGRPWDDRRYFGKIKTPSQCPVSHGPAWRNKFSQPIDEFQSAFERQSGKGFADVKRLAIAIEVAVICFAG